MWFDHAHLLEHFLHLTFFLLHPVPPQPLQGWRLAILKKESSAWGGESTGCTLTSTPNPLVYVFTLVNF